MLTIEKTVLPSPEQWGIIIDGMRNPMNSWAKSDSHSTHIEDSETQECADFEFFLGDADHSLMTRLANGGPVHAKYRRMIPVYVTINAPLYWWKEFDTYKVGTVCNSCSTMHKIHSKEFTLDDFSHEHLFPNIIGVGGTTVVKHGLGMLADTIFILNAYRDDYLKTKDKRYWRQMIQLLPTSYNQKRTVMLNYEVLVGIYRWRKDHKLDEWHTFCDWIRGLPYADLIVGDAE
jgi:hypothetical protein